MILEQTKLREDVVISRQETPEGISFIVKNPDTGRFFRFGAVEQCIIEQLDGRTSLEEIRDRVEQRFGAPLSAATLLRFVENLKRCGLIEHEHGAGERVPKPTRQGRLRGRLLYLRLKAFDPDRLFSRMLPYINLFFTSAFIIVSAITILLAFAVAITNSSEIHQGLRSLYRFDAILLALIIVTTATTAHEFAHGLTCKHFGAEVHELGFLLIYFQPAFYCNISEAWLLPKKSERLWITFAGAYFELFIWGVAVLTWRLTEPGTVPNFLGLIITATSAVKSFFNRSEEHTS